MSKGGIASGFAFGYDPTGRSVFIKIDRIHYSMFDVGRSMFDVRCSLVSLLIKLAAVQARGGAYMKLIIVGSVNRLNVEHRTSNIEY
jgi:hypothetical protein